MSKAKEKAVIPLDGLKETYKLWVDYLKYSEKYQKAHCFLKEVFDNNPFFRYMFFDCEPPEEMSRGEIYNQFIGLYLSFSPEQKELLYDLSESYIVFRDVNDPFDKIWKRICECYPFINTQGVKVLRDELDPLFKTLKSRICGDLQALIDKPKEILTPDEIIGVFKERLREVLTDSLCLYTVTYVLPSDRKRKEIIGTNILKKQYCELLNEYKEKENKVSNDILYTNPSFVYPTTIKLNRLLREYLDIYKKIKEEGWSQEDDHKVRYWYYEIYVPSHDIRAREDFTTRGFIRTVEEIISNVDRGIFPGPHTPPSAILV